MKRIIVLLIVNLLLINFGCVSIKEFTDYKYIQTTKVGSIENDLVNLNSRIYKLSTEITELNKTLEKTEKANDQNINLLTTELKDKIKNINDLIGTLRIEVALLIKKSE
jgi:hypothetical protein